MSDKRMHVTCSECHCKVGIPVQEPLPSLKSRASLSGTDHSEATGICHEPAAPEPFKRDYRPGDTVSALFPDLSSYPTYKGVGGPEPSGEFAEPRDKGAAVRLERGADYGDVRLNHASIGAIWGGILLQAMSANRWHIGEALPPELVTLMMVGVKLSREAYRHKEDNIVDGKNYLDFTQEVS